MDRQAEAPAPSLGVGSIPKFSCPPLLAMDQPSFCCVSSLVEDPKEVEWANVLKRKHAEIAVDNQCWSCATVAARAFHGRKWSDIVSQVKTSETFAETFRVAKQVLAGSSTPSWLPERVQEASSSSCKMQVSMVLMTEEEFQDEHNLKLSSHPDLQMLFVAIPGFGDTKYLALKDPEAPHRRLLLEQGVEVASKVQIMSEKESLRPEQGKELVRFIQKEKSRHEPSLAKAMTFADMKAMVVKAKAAAEKHKEEEIKAEVKEEAPLASPKRGGQREQSEKEDVAMGLCPDSPDRMVSRVRAPLVPGLTDPDAAAKKGKGAGKQKKGAAKGKASPKSVPKSRPAKAKPGVAKAARWKPSVKREFEPGTAGSSSGGTDPPGKRQTHSKASTTASRAGDADYDQEQYDKWLQALSVPSALDGVSMKQPIYQSARILQTLDEASAEYANMACARETVVMAEELRAKFYSYSPAERDKMMDRVLTGESGNDIPFAFKEKVLTQKVRDTMAKVSVSSVPAWVMMVTPGSPKKESDMITPEGA